MDSVVAGTHAEALRARAQRRRRRSSREAKRARHLTRKLVHKLATPDPDPGQLRKLVGELHPALGSVRRSILSSNDRHAKLVANGIDDLASAFANLVHAQQSAKAGSRIKHLSDGTRALEKATIKARKAGDAWPL